MKICIISIHFLETTFPLAKHISDCGHDVSLYCVFPKENRKGFVIDYTPYNVKSGFDSQYNDVVYKWKLKEYLKNIKIYTFFFTHISKNPISNIFLGLKLAFNIKRKKYDVVHFIGDSPFFNILYFFIQKRNIVHTLHEVTSHDLITQSPWYQDILLNKLQNRNVELIFHSEISLNRFRDFKNKKNRKKNPSDNLNVVHFGLFETYRCFEEDEEISEEEATILYFGRILPYKGLKYLIDAVKIMQDDLVITKLIIAGNGTIDVDTKSINNIEIYNKLLTNIEIIRLIKRSKVIVCPYISASQSGIPMVAYLFGKPVIATNVGGFPEVIENYKTGILVPPCDSKSLADAIRILVTKPKLIEDMKSIIGIKYSHSDYAWSEIAKQTIYIYEKVISRLCS